MKQIQIKLGYFSPICLSNKSLGRSGGMVLSEFNCDSTLETYWAQGIGNLYRKVQDSDKLELGLKQNALKYKVANVILDYVRVGFEIRVGEMVEWTIECYKIEGTLLKFRPTKESKQATRERQVGATKYKYVDKIEVETHDIVLGILCGYIQVKFDFNIDDNELISIITSKQFNTFKIG